MNMFLYDNTFEGLLSAIFYAYEFNILPDKICYENDYQDMIFVNKYKIITEQRKAGRLWNYMKRRSSKQTCQMVYRVFLSEEPDIEILLFNYVKLLIDSPDKIETDYGNDCVLKINQIHKKVAREAHRVHMFVRFQKTADDIYYASFEPLYNVLPLSVKHFKNRFSDQRWIIYDVKRQFGYYYDLKNVREIKITNSKINFATGKINKNILNHEEKFFQVLWKNYFDSINIKERKNLKLHMQFLPKRFWKYLPEKNQV